MNKISQVKNNIFVIYRSAFLYEDEVTGDWPYNEVFWRILF